MNLVHTCPKTLEEVYKASKRLGCHNDQFQKNQYMCIPNVQKTSLVEFCHNGIMGIQEKGTCLEVDTANGNLSTQSCTDFSSGCPEVHVWKYQLFNYTACQNINPKYQCYVLQPSCPPTDNSSDDDVHISIQMILVIIAVVVVFIFIIILLLLLIRRYRKGKRKDMQGPSVTIEMDAKNEEKEDDNHLLTDNSNQTPSQTTHARIDETDLMIETPDLHQATTMPDNKPDGPHKDEEEPFFNRERSATLGVSATKKQKIHEVKGHEFQSFFFKQPTYCSFCDKLLRGAIKKQGYKCRKPDCNLAVHKNCHEKIEGNCNGSKNDSKMMSGGIDQNYRHKFKINTYKSPTYCKHCGSLLYGVYKQGLKCEVCDINCHKKCESFISYPCGARK